MPAATVRTLLSGLIDYAGLFPPAALPLPQVAENYRTYRASSSAWALGRLVIPVARLDALTALLAGDTAWHVSAVVGDDVARDLEVIARWNGAESARAVVDAIEVKANSVSEITAISEALRDDLTTYVEIPVSQDPRELIAAIRDGGVRAKVRTGGVVAGAFPHAAQVARFLGACAKATVPFKATAGLHHPLRGDYRLTYEPDAVCGRMFGFLNVFIAAAFARFGMDEAQLVALLDESDMRAFEFSDAGLVWRDHSLALHQVADTRGAFAASFGSCSFREPIDDLVQLGVL